MPNLAPVVTDTLHALESAGVGSVFTKTANGWDVKWVDGGTAIYVQGATIEDALGSHGAQVIHPVKEVPQGIVEVELEEPRIFETAPVFIPDGGHEAIITIDPKDAE